MVRGPGRHSDLPRAAWWQRHYYSGLQGLFNPQGATPGAGVPPSSTLGALSNIGPHMSPPVPQWRVAGGLPAGLCAISRGFSACPGMSQGAGTHVQLLSPRAMPMEDPQVVAPGRTPDGWQGMGWHPSVPTAALAEAAPPRAVRASCQAHVHHPSDAVSWEASVSGDAQERLVLPVPIPDGCDADGDASRQPSRMPLCCQENGTSLHRDPRDQPWLLVGWHVSPPWLLGTSSPHPHSCSPMQSDRGGGGGGGSSWLY